MKNALLSVYHKDGIIEFAKELTLLGWNIYASGGTAKHLSNALIEVQDVATLVGGGAILGHRVVTLSREIHAGLLSRSTPEDEKELSDLNIPRFDLVCVDLYPLQDEIAKPEATRESVINQTDIGGPTMIRSGAKGGRIVICDPKDRKLVIDYLKNGEEDPEFVRRLAAKAESIISRYCSVSADYLSEGDYKSVFGKKLAPCKYGENGYQTPSALYTSGSDDPLSLDKFDVVEGTPPSYNNYCDIDRLLQTATHIAAGFHKNRGKTPQIAVGGKHGNCCGAAIGNSPEDVVKKMLAGDPLSIFGGLILLNFPVDESIAALLAGKMLDGVIAPDFRPEAIAMLRRKGDKCRFIRNLALSSLDSKSLDQAERFRYVRGGFLKQPNYTFILDLNSSESVKHTTASEEVENDLLLAWAVGSTSNSNTITIVKSGQLLGNGVGQQDRVGAAKLAIERANRSKHELKGASAYSDSFFPFPDAPKTLIDAGISAILSTSGSVRDNETIELCKQEGVVLYMVPDSIGRGFFNH